MPVYDSSGSLKVIGITGGAGGGGVTDHGALTGLADDDHTQYLLVSGSRAMTGNLAMAGFDITGVNLVDGRDVSGDGGKLDGIEALADVTDATNVNAAGAVMESDFMTTHAILVRQGAATPAALAIPLSSFVGRIGSGDVIALTTAQAKTLLAYVASEVGFTPSGDISATTVQTAIVEVRDDTDTKLGAKVDVGGQIGGTAASPTILGARETAGPTLLTYGAIADGQVLSRSGSAIVGVASGGGGGGGGFPTIEIVEGFTTSDYYEHSTAAPGAATPFSVVWYGQIRGYRTTGGQYLICRSDGGANGWHIQVGGRSGDGFFVIAGIGLGTVTTTFDARPPVAHIALVFDGTTLSMYINGNRTDFTGTPTFSATATPLRIGMITAWGEPHTQGGWAGSGYIESALTAEQLQDHLQECRDADREFVAGGITWISRWSAAAPGGTFPGTIDDLGAAGLNLSRIGTAITATTVRQVV